MSDRNAASRMTLADALHALPLAAPGCDTWSALAAQLVPTTRAPRWRYALSAALAAGIVLAVIATQVLRRDLPTPNTAARSVATVADVRASAIASDAKVSNVMNATNATNAATPDDTQLAALQLRSQALERWLRDTGRAASPLPGQDLAAASEIENLIGLVDIELGGSARAGALPLWHRRVALLEDLTALRYSNYQLAAGGDAIAAAGRLD
jgi:hypothetical protein